MIEGNVITAPDVPSAKKIVLASIIAVCIAAVLLVVAVLPAEYGIDPLGTGRALGLTELSEAAAPLDLKALAEAPPVPIGNAQLQTAPVLSGWNRDHSYLYKTDSRKIPLKPGGKVEFKYQMRKGDNLVYSWDTTVKVPYEFHGEPNVGAKGTYESYAKDYESGADHGNGSFTAPFTGIHGWYWENKTDSPIVINLRSAGFYKGAEEFIDGAPAKFVPLEDVE